MDNQSLAERLKYHRKNQGLSQEELSHRTNVAVRTIQRIENAEVNPHLKTVKLLAVALDIEVNELLHINNPNEETIKTKWLLLMHATPVLGLFIPLSNVLFPFFLWIHKRDDNPIYYKHGVKVINFQITALLIFILSLVCLLTIEHWGFYIFIVTIPLWLVIVIYNIVAVSNNNKCYYPFSIPFLKIKSPQVSTVIIAFLSLFTLGSCVQMKQTKVTHVDGKAILKDSISHKIKQLMTDAKVTGLGVTIFNDNKVAYQKTFGYANIETKELLDPNHIFYGASLSKSVFAYLVAQMVVDNKINLDKPLNSYFNVELPDLPIEQKFRKLTDLKGDTRYKKITTKMCLSHSTGLPNWRWINNPGEKLKILFDPGTSHSYSGEGIMLAQWLVEYLEKKPLENLATERIFKPLKMTQTDFLWRKEFKKHFCYGHSKNQKKLPKDIELDDAAAAGSMETTLIDYSKFLQHILTLWSKDSKITQLLFTPSIRIKSKAQFGPLAKETTTENDAIKLSYGLGWALIETPYGKAALRGGHSEGFQHYSIIFPEIKTGVVIMSNSDNAESIFKELLEITIGDRFTPWKWKGYTPYKK